MPLLDTREGRDLTGTLVADIVEIGMKAVPAGICGEIPYSAASCLHSDARRVKVLREIPSCLPASVAEIYPFFQSSASSSSKEFPRKYLPEPLSCRFPDKNVRPLPVGTVGLATNPARALGYKPYVAPALSSGALSLLACLRGEWHRICPADRPLSSRAARHRGSTGSLTTQNIP